MHHSASKPPLDPSIPVSPNNPCPFLRGLVGEGFVEGGTVPLNTLSQTIANATGETGLKKVSARIQVRGVAMIANGIKHILKSIWSGAQLDALRGGPHLLAAGAGRGTHLGQFGLRLLGGPAGLLGVLVRLRELGPELIALRA